MGATITTGGDPSKVDVDGDTMTGFLTLHADPSSALHAATKQYVDDEVAGAGGGGAVAITDSGPITTGNVTAANGVLTHYPPDVTFPAQAGDRIMICVEAVAASTGAAVAFDAASRVSSADVNYVSSGNNTPLQPGTRGAWYLAAASHTQPAPVYYTIQAGDISGGTVTLRFYAAGDGNTRVINASSVLPGRIVVYNFGQAP